MNKWPRSLIRVSLILNICTAFMTAPIFALDFDPNVSMTYLGAFRFPSSSGSGEANTFDYGGDDIGFNPVTNTIRATGHDWEQRTAEITIPSSFGSNVSNAPQAAYAQPWGECTDGRLGQIGPGPSKMGGYLIDDFNGDGTFEVISTAYIYYDASGQASGSHFLSKTLSIANTTDIEGPFAPSGTSPGHVGWYMAKVPASFQARLGTKYVTGMCCTNIISRTSFGAALFGFDPAQMVNNPSDRTFDTTAFIDYPRDREPYDFNAPFSASNPFNSVTQISGVFFYDDPTGDTGDAAIFYGVQGIGETCYKDSHPQCSNGGGYGVVGGDFDTMLWIYKISDLVDVKNGVKRPNQVHPRTVTLPWNTTAGRSGGATFDPATNRLYLGQGCAYGNCSPAIHVFQMNTTPPTPSAPTISAQPTNRTVSVGATATFSVTATGNPAPTYQWQKGTTNISGATSASYTTPATVLGDSGSTYRCVVSNNLGTVTSNAATLTVTPVNLAPTANAGVDRTVTLPTTLDIDGSASDDGLPNNNFTVTWSKFSGPGTVTFTFPSGNNADPTVSFSAAGSYVLRITATDGALTTTDNVNVTVNPAVVNQSPSVDAGPAQTITQPASANLDGTVYDDGYPVPPGAVTVTWSCTSGQVVTFGNANSIDTTASFQSAGPHTLQLSVSDGQYTRTDTVQINVNSVPIAPSLTLASPIQTITLPALVNLAATIVHGGPGFPVIAWTKVSGPGNVTFATPSELQTSALFSAAGVYVLRITATENGLSDSEDATITVNPAAAGNQPPTVNAGGDFDVELPAIGTLRATIVDDAVAGPVTVTWSLNGTTPAGLQPVIDNPDSLTTTVRFTQAGLYTFIARVTDGQYSNSDFVQVSVHNTNVAPVVNAGNDLTIISPAFASLNATVSDHGPLPLTITANWTKISGPGNVIFGPTNAIKTIATFSSLGTYVLRLTASDGLLSASDEVTVLVTGISGPPNQAPVISAGEDQTIDGAVAQLRGSVSDPDGPNPPEPTWSKMSGPGNIKFANANAFETEATFSAGGTYLIRLNVYDGATNSQDYLTVIVPGAVGAAPPPSKPPLKNSINPKNSSVEVYCNNGRIKIFNLFGEMVYESACSGEKMNWPGINNQQEDVSSGIYLYELGDAKRKISVTR